MLPFAAATGVQAAAALAAALTAGAVLVFPQAGRRRAAMPVALALAALAVLAVAEDQVREQIADRSATMLAAGALAAVGGLAVLGAVFRRWPAAFVVAAVVALPARIPFTVGGETANLLLPLYAVIAAGVVAALAGGLRRPDDLRPAPVVPEGDGVPDRQARRAAAAAPRPRRRFAAPPVTFALAGVVVLYAAQALYSTDAEAATKDVAFFYVPFAVLLRLLLDVTWSRRLVRVLLGTVTGLAALFAVVGLYQYVTRDLLLDNEKVLLANELKPYFRVNSLFFDPNIYGRFLALTMLLVTAALLWARERRTVWRCAPVLALLWAGLVPSLSESSFAALTVGLGVLAALRWSWKPVALAAAGVVAIGIAVVVLAPSAVGVETASFDQLNRSTSGRAELIRGGLEMAADRPVGGFGSGSFAERYRDRENLLSPRSPAESHTIPVTVLAEQGAIGLVAYLTLLVAAFATVFGAVHRDPARAAVAAAFTALVVHTLVYASFLEDPLTWTVLAAALAIRRDVEPARQAERAAPPPRAEVAAA